MAMSRNKDRLYLALYVRGGTATMQGLEDTYHWGLLVGPKKEDASSRGTRFHAKESIVLVNNTPRSTWDYEEVGVDLAPDGTILVRILIAKIKDKYCLWPIFRRTPIRRDVEGWNCVGWVQEAYEKALESTEALGRSVPTWDAVHDQAMLYVETKRAEHRFDGQVPYDMTKVPTWDMLQDKELVQ